MQVRSGLVRGGIAAAAAGAALLLAAQGATADTGAKAEDGAAKGRVISGAGTNGWGVNLDKGNDNQHPYDTVLFGLKLTDGSMLKMYCVQLEKNVDLGQDMVETPWDKYPDPDPKAPFRLNNDKINWVLHHGFPTEDLKSLESALAAKGVTLHDGLTQAEAIAGTQAALWHFSDNEDLDRDKPVPYGTADNGADVLALYDYLTGSDNTGIGQQPKPTLSITPSSAKGEAGTRIGPFTIASTGDITDLTTQLPDGVKLTDADGKALAEGDIKDGSKLYLDVPKDAKAGTAELALKAVGHLDTGRLFVGENYAEHPAQSLIVAESQKTTVDTSASASWAEAGVTPPTTPAAPTSQAPAAGGSQPLANTGVNAGLPIGIGAALVLAGGAMLVLVRRRRSNA
ncbi:thioester domain-containing protein [Amycolatopsis sp. FDAARGOS 1241]|uniref:thioester domain-containing protein n=1 Tax=Amycolatopsis sp. FDAARGOS 1241 TaxID=2778070 RepID=UPI00195256EF|nr:thioester domain-containing protein [Amycolatopsis sp. FDAARGOS 1241]QRP47126.1 thioester domain-containing protein [Amycolatopsis sp. FDAARGOS 1241]